MTQEGRARLRNCCVAAVVAATIAITLSGCGTHRVQPSASPSATFDLEIPPTPAASDYVSAILNTRSRGSAKLNTTITIDTPAGQRVFSGKGSTFLEPGYGLMTWSDDDSSFVEMVNDEGIFVQSEQPDGRWTQTVTAKSKGPDVPIGITTTSGSFDPLRGLGVLENVVDEGTETLGKLAATRYSGYLPVTEEELRAMGLNNSEIASLGDSWRGADQRVTVWIDPGGLVARVDRVIELADATGGPLSIKSTTTIGNFGTTLDVTSPSSDLVDTASTTPE